METSQLLDAGFDQAGPIFADVHRDHMRASTPCAGWDVRALLNHVVAANTMFATIVNGDELDLSVFERDLLGEDPAGAFARAAKSAQGAWHRDRAFDRTYRMPWLTIAADTVEVPADVVAGANVAELVVHAWDLSRATARPLALDEELVRATLAFVQQPEMQPYWDQQGEFAPALPGAPEMPAADQLAVRFGRRVG